MKNIKDIVIGIFAVIGFAAIVTGFTNESVQEHTLTESHVWEGYAAGGSEGRFFTLNKITGEIRQMDDFFTTKTKDNSNKYVVMIELTE